MLNSPHDPAQLGQREQEANAVAVRIHGKGQQGVKPRAEVVADVCRHVAAPARNRRKRSGTPAPPPTRVPPVLSGR